MPGESTRRKVVIKRPRLPGKLAAGAIPDGGVESRGYYDGMLISGLDLSGQEARHPTFDGVRGVEVDLSGTHFARLALTDVRLERCAAVNAEWPETTWRRVEIDGCQAIGLIASEARFEDVTFRECNLRLATFRFSAFKAVRFERCVMDEADFAGADLSGVVFVGCDLRNADLSTTKLIGADLRGSNLDGLRVDAPALRGAIVDPTQAVVLARALGLVVEWSEGPREGTAGA